MKTVFHSFNARLWFGTLLSAMLPWVLLSPFMHMKINAYGVSILLVALAHYINASTVYMVTNYPGKKTALTVIPNTLLWFFLAWVAGKFLSLPYSLKYLALGGIFSFFISCFGFVFRVRRTPVLGFVPLSQAEYADRLPGVRWIRVDFPRLPERQIDGIVADLHNSDLSAEWQRFLANQTLKGMPVYHIRKVREELTGRVKITHMYENDLGSLLPSKIYTLIKHMLDVLFVALMMPLAVTIGIVVAILIKLEDGGSVFYTQPRVGQGGKPFKLYKFRSMKENVQERITHHCDDRITKVGAFLRKARIDEIPQFINVLKGEMSLIGPRAEYKLFADDLEKQIPFYAYRHIVKPGISGWAQVMHGYATGAKETQIKIEYDFYYIKHFSFSLDVLIFFKTIKTILTGFGAR